MVAVIGFILVAAVLLRLGLSLLALPFSDLPTSVSEQAAR